MKTHDWLKVPGTVLIAATLTATAARAAELEFTVEPPKLSLRAEDAFVLRVSATNGTADATFKVYDAKGALVRSLGGRRVRGQKLEIPWNLKDDLRAAVKPGQYTVRLESGWGLALDPGFGDHGVLAGPPFVSPRDLAVDRAGKLYVLDGGAAVLYKFHPDGRPADDLGGEVKIAAPATPYWGNVAVGPDGRIYLPQTSTTSHSVDVYDGHTGQRVMNVGGFFIDDPEWKTTKGGIAYPALARLNGESRLYLSSPGYQMLWCFDPRQAGKAGGLWATRDLAPGDAGTTDGRRTLYLISAYYTERNTLIKILDGDTGAERVCGLDQYFDSATGSMEFASDMYGVAYAGGGDLYAVRRGAGKLIKFVDGGTRLDGIASLGTKGKDAAKLEFVVPSSIVASPDGKSLYIGEDGEKVSDKDSTPGQARVTKYTISHAVKKEITVTVEP